MTETESELHSRLEERDAEIEASRSEILKVNAEIIEARATIARVEALHVEGNDPDGRERFCAEDGFMWPCATVRALATQPTEARP